MSISTTLHKKQLSELVGKPYKSGAHGPNEFDCWGLVVYIYQNIFDVQLPEYAGFESKAKYPAKMQREIFKQDSQWQIIDKVEPFCCVAMSRTKVINHVGVWIDTNGGLCLHAVANQAVLAEPLSKLRLKGFGNMIFLRLKRD